MSSGRTSDRGVDGSSLPLSSVIAYRSKASLGYVLFGVLLEHHRCCRDIGDAAGAMLVRDRALVVQRFSRGLISKGGWNLVAHMMAEIVPVAPGSPAAMPMAAKEVAPTGQVSAVSSHRKVEWLLALCRKTGSFVKPKKRRARERRNWSTDVTT